MLDKTGNLLGKLIRTRLTTAIRTVEDFHEKQFGFRSRRSTVDVIQELCEAVRRVEDHNHFSRRVVLLDVKNSFNSVTWSDNVLDPLDHGLSRVKLSAVDGG